MIKSLFLGAILGGLTAFVWSMVSWEVIGWHEKTMLSFERDEEVAAVISTHAPKSGTYMLPGMPSTEGMTPEQKRAVQIAIYERFSKGPIVVAAVRTGGFGSCARGIVIQLLGMIAAAFLLTWLVLQTRGLSYGGRVMFLAVVGLAAGIITEIPNWNWWGFSGPFTAVNVADDLLTWFFAGLVIAKVAKPFSAPASTI